MVQDVVVDAPLVAEVEVLVARAVLARATTAVRFVATKKARHFIPFANRCCTQVKRATSLVTAPVLTRRARATRAASRATTRATARRRRSAERNEAHFAICC